jgi:hypothetical protein
MYSFFLVTSGLTSSGGELGICIATEVKRKEAGERLLSPASIVERTSMETISYVLGNGVQYRSRDGFVVCST